MSKEIQDKTYQIILRESEIKEIIEALVSKEKKDIEVDTELLEDLKLVLRGLL